MYGDQKILPNLKDPYANGKNLSTFSVCRGTQYIKLWMTCKNMHFACFNFLLIKSISYCVMLCFPSKFLLGLLKCKFSISPRGGWCMSFRIQYFYSAVCIDVVKVLNWFTVVVYVICCLQAFEYFVVFACELGEQ